VIFFLCSIFYGKELSKVSERMQQDDLTSRVQNLESQLAALQGQISSSTGTTIGGINILNYMYKDATIYQDIFDAYNSNIFTKMGAASGWDETSYAAQPGWNNRRILRIGVGVASNGNGIKVAIKPGTTTLWLRILGDRWTCFRVMPENPNSQADFTDWNEVYCGGYRNLNEISPDGAGPDTMWNVHQWVPIPVRRGAVNYNVYSGVNSDSWISGIAFGTNLWNHAKNSGVSFYWAVNGGTGTIGWGGENWNSDHLAYFPAGSTVTVMVPVVWTGKDKILYIQEHNNNWMGTQHGAVTINGQAVERFRTSYNNPFAVHHNSKIYSRYMATRIPANLINQNDKFVSLTIDMSKANQNIHFRELGTHDYF